MSYIIKAESFDSLAQAYRTNPTLMFPSVFVTPAFLESWWQSFHEEKSEASIMSIWSGENLLGIAPLQIKDSVASFIGSPDVCDYLDFITVPGKEREFFGAFFDDLKNRGMKELDLNPVRQDSGTMTVLTDIAVERGYEVALKQEDVSLETALPKSWDEYLALLDGKQRHELRRKLRRLNSAGSVEYKIVEDSRDTAGAFDTFLNLFAGSKGEKTAFMTEKMAGFFRKLTDSLSKAGLIRFGALSLEREIIAMVMCFEYKDIVYLYNSAYNPDYSELSPGIASKAYYIRDSIEKGKKIFNFLKGSETYKYQMGGSEVPIFSYHIKMN